MTLVASGGGLFGGGGGKSRKGASETPTTIASRSSLHALFLICEGEIVGPSTDDLLQDVYFDETPVKNGDGTYNFKDVVAEFRPGTLAQTHIPGFTSVENESVVGVQVKKATGPVTRTITTPDLDAVRVRLSFPTLQKVDTETGEIEGTTVSYVIQVSTQNGPFIERVRDTINEKFTSPYERSYRINLTTAGPWDIRVVRLTPDSDSNSLSNDLIWQAYTEIEDVKLRYPNSALLGIRISAENFSSLPKVSFKGKFKIIRVPSNYNPLTRTYGGIWDGSFEYAWSDNPAWIYYDLATNPVYGLGQYIDVDQIDKWALYRIGQYCDELVESGIPGVGMEPRFRCSPDIRTKADAYEVLGSLAAAFRGAAYWVNGSITATQDRPAEAVKLFTEANVYQGVDDSGKITDPPFNYSATGKAARHSVAMVTWSNPNNFYRTEVEYVELPDSVNRYGYNPISLVDFGGCSRGQARRLGLWTLVTEKYDTQTVTFKTPSDGAMLKPGDIIKIMDPLVSNKQWGGRVVAYNSANAQITLDRPIRREYGITYQLSVAMPDGTLATRSFGPIKTGTNWTYYSDTDFGSLGGEKIADFTRTRFEHNSSNDGHGATTPDNTYSVIVQANVQPRYSETYTLTLVHDDDCAWVINGVTVLPFSGTVGEKTRSFTYTFDSTRRYHFAFHLRNNGGRCRLSPRWQSTSQALETLPGSQINLIYKEDNVLAVSSAFPQVVQKNAVWLATEPNLEAQQFRVFSIVESDTNLFEITAIEHTPDKNGFIDFGDPIQDLKVALVPPKVPNIPWAVEPNVDPVLLKEKWVFNLRLEWEQPLYNGGVDPFTVRYEVQYKAGIYGAWQGIISTTNTTVAYENLPEIKTGYKLRVRAVDVFNRPSVWVESPMAIPVRPKPPAPVGQIQYDLLPDSRYVVTWSDTQHYPFGLEFYRIYLGSKAIQQVDPSRQFSSPIRVVPGDYIVTVKSVDLAGQESETGLQIDIGAELRPPSPTGTMSFKNVGGKSLQFFWEDSTTYPSNFKGYNLYFSDRGKVLTTLNKFTNPIPMEPIDRTITLKPVNTIGMEPITGLSLFIAAGDYYLPAPQGEIFVVHQGNGSIIVQWLDNTIYPDNAGGYGVFIDGVLKYKTGDIDIRDSNPIFVTPGDHTIAVKPYDTSNRFTSTSISSSLSSAQLGMPDPFGKISKTLATDGGIVLKWTDTRAYPISFAGYRIYVDGVLTYTTPAKQSVSIPPNKPLTGRTVIVKAYSSAGLESPTGISSTLDVNNYLPNDLTYLLVDQNLSGLKRFYWGVPSNMAPDVVSFRVRYNVGTNYNWTSSHFVADIPASQKAFETELFRQGNYSVLIKAVDVTGLESKQAVYSVVNLGDPIVDNLVQEFDFKAQGFPGTLNNMTYDSTAGVLNVVDPTVRASYITSFIPTQKGDMKVYAVSDSNYAIRYRKASPFLLWTDDAALLWTDDAALLWSQSSDFVLFPVASTASQEEYNLEFFIKPTGAPANVSELKVLVDAPDQIETFQDLRVSNLGTRLPLTKNYVVLKVVNVTLQYIQGDTGVTVRIVDKNFNLGAGPLIEVLNSLGNRVAGTVDVTVIGY